MRFVRRLIPLLAAALLGAAGAATFTHYHHDAAAPVLSALDIGFAQDMSAHHQQAVTLSEMLTPDAAPEVRALADQIRSTQLNEIGQMTGWLQVADAPPNSTHPMAWMHDEHSDASMKMPMSMPGMASTADLIRLQHSTGRANTALYLQLMIRHHQGGIDMAAKAFQRSRTEAVRRAATAMVDEQTQEIQVMTILLAGYSADPLPYP